MSDSIDYEESSGNVFADLDLPDPEIRLAKAKLARQIARVIAERGWKQSEAAEALGLHQPEVSNIVRGRLRDFSLDRLMTVLNRAGQDVAIVVHLNREPARRGRLDVRSDDDQVAASASRSRLNAPGLG
jgi:predicted XRE-type DNA-binding protein